MLLSNSQLQLINITNAKPTGDIKSSKETLNQPVEPTGQ